MCSVPYCIRPVDNIIVFDYLFRLSYECSYELLFVGDPNNNTMQQQRMKKEKIKNTEKQHEENVKKQTKPDLMHDVAIIN